MDVDSVRSGRSPPSPRLVRGTPAEPRRSSGRAASRHWWTDGATRLIVRARCSAQRRACTRRLLPLARTARPSACVVRAARRCAAAAPASVALLLQRRRRCVRRDATPPAREDSIDDAARTSCVVCQVQSNASLVTVRAVGSGLDSHLTHQIRVTARLGDRASPSLHVSPVSYTVVASSRGRTAGGEIR